MAEVIVANQSKEGVINVLERMVQLRNRGAKVRQIILKGRNEEDIPSDIIEDLLHHRVTRAKR